MEKQFVQVACNVHVNWSGAASPSYRVYVNNELFTERNWKWPGYFLEEIIQIEAVPGKYRIKYELVQPHRAVLSVTNMRVVHGPGRIKDNEILRIL